MNRYIELSIIVCLVFILNSSAKTITPENNDSWQLTSISAGTEALEESGVNSANTEVTTYVLNPLCTSWPTFYDTGDIVSGFLGLQAHFAFDLSSIPDDATIVSATFSAYLYNGATVPSWRKLWYYSNDNWINIVYSTDPGDSVVGDKLVGTLMHFEQPDEGYVWKTITMTYDGWAKDIADGYISLMLTDGQYGAAGLGPGTTGYSGGVLKEPELTLTILSNPLPITVASPNGGESWLSGTSQTIIWYSTGTAGANVKIELYKNDSYLRDIIASTANDGSYTWPVPSDLSAGTNYKVKIIDTGDSSKYDYSDDYFNVTVLPSPSGSLQFKSSEYAVAEDGGTIRIYVSRTGGSSGAASVNYTTYNGAATAGSDYTAKSGTLTWTNGDAADKYFDVLITGDSIYEGNEDFIANLSSASGASPGSPGQTTVTIMDDDSPPVVYRPEVDTLPPVDVADTNAILRGKIDDDGYEEGTEPCRWRFSIWKHGDEGNVITTDWECCVNEGQIFSLYVDGLEPNTVYNFIAEAANSTGTDQGNTETFTTLPEYVDPNTIPPKAFNPDETNTLLIQNFIKQFQTDFNDVHACQGLLTYVEKAGNINGIDGNDIFYYEPEKTSSTIVSLVLHIDLVGDKHGICPLSKDARPYPVVPNDPYGMVLLELGVYNNGPGDLHINSENVLKFWLAENAFEKETVTIQKISIDPNIEYPVWDIRNVISVNDRQLPLDYLVTDPNEVPADPNISVTITGPNIPYAWFTLSTSREIADIDDNGIIDLNDSTILLSDLGKVGILRTDIASLKNNKIVLGIPDGKVNEIDDIAFITEYNKQHPDDPITPPISFSEGFESGKIQKPFVTSGNSPWIISTDSYEGNYCVKSGIIENSKSSILEAKINTPSGKISFSRKVSCESDFDNLIFYIDGVEAGRWSGERAWEEVNFQTTPGIHIFKWIYKKDYSVEQGADAAWIDNIAVSSFEIN